MSDNMKKEILGKEIDEDQLDKVTGGGAKGKGGCEKNYYSRQCGATVEKGSHCAFSNDYCWVLSNQYV